MRNRRLSTVRAASCAVSAMLLFTACGKSSDAKGTSVTVTTGKGGGPASIRVSAHDIYYDPARVTAPAGEIEVSFVDKGTQTHSLLIEGVDGFKLSVSSAHRDDSGKVDLEPGEYKYYCDIPGHRAQGMEGTLVLE